MGRPGPAVHDMTARTEPGVHVIYNEEFFIAVVMGIMTGGAVHGAVPVEKKALGQHR